MLGCNGEAVASLVPSEGPNGERPKSWGWAGFQGSMLHTKAQEGDTAHVTPLNTPDTPACEGTSRIRRAPSPDLSGHPPPRQG